MAASPIDPVTGLAWTRAEDRKRAEHSELRYQMLTGMYWDALEKALNTHLPAERRRVWGPMDMTSNVFRSICGDLGPVPYTTPPSVTGPAGSEVLITSQSDGILSRAGYWPLMQSTGEELVGLRDLAVRLEYSEDGGLSAEPIPPHRYEVDVLPSAPRRPVRMAIADLRERPDKPGAMEWTWEEWDISDPMAPRYRIMAADRKQDITARYAELDGKPATSGMLSGENWPSRWRWHQGDRNGKPFIPAANYHALTRARYWDTWYGIEAISGSLTLAVLNTFWVHCVRDGSVATVILIGGVPTGIKIEDADGTPIAWVSVEPGAFNMVQPLQGYEGTVTAQRLAPSADPLMLIQAIQRFEERVALYAGVSASDLVRQSGDPRSGYALSVSNDGKRGAAKRLEPQLRVGDIEAIETSAALINGAKGSSIPESGYGIGYTGIPLSPEELRVRSEYVGRMMDLGLMTRADALLQFRPEWSASQITTYLAQADAERASRGPSMIR